MAKLAKNLKDDKKTRPNGALGFLLDTSKNTQMQPGEPRVIPLVRYDNDRTARGFEWISCCGCGYRHLITYEVFQNDDGMIYMVDRAYADGSTYPKKVVRAKK